MVRAQAMLLEQLGIRDLFLCIGGSMGGMQVLQWAALYPERVFAAMPIATGARHSAQNIAFHEVGRQAIMADPAWADGRYLEAGTRPAKGLGVARMGAHITYLSEPALHRKFGRRFQGGSAPTFSFDADFQIESYLRHQGLSFVERFDANAYLYLTRAMDYFDLAADHGGVLANAFRGTKTRFCVISFTSDWLFPTADSRAIVHALNAAAAPGRLRRGRERQGPRRLPARRAGDVLGRPRLHRRRRPGARPVMRRDARQAPLGKAATGAPWEAPTPCPARAEGGGARVDHLVVLGLVPAGARVLDIGCGDGSLLALLRDRRGIDGRGIELSREGVNACLARGLPVIQGDADTDLANYPDDAFDVVVLSQTIQATPQPADRAGAPAAHRPAGDHLVPEFRALAGAARSSAFRGRMPVTEIMPDAWYETPNIHHCTIRDFVGLCRVVGAQIETRHGARRPRPADALRHALVGLEPVRRAGGVPAPARGCRELADAAPNPQRRYVSRRPEHRGRKRGKLHPSPRGGPKSFLFVDAAQPLHPVIPGPCSGTRDPDTPTRHVLAAPVALDCPPPACLFGSGLALGDPEDSGDRSPQDTPAERPACAGSARRNRSETELGYS